MARKASSKPASAAGDAIKDAVRRLKGVPSGFVTDAMTRLGLSGWMDGVLPVQPRARVVGPAVTLRYAPKRGADKSPMNIYEIIRTCSPGDVLVIDTGGTSSWIMGENMAHHGQYQGLAAMITDSRVRDFAEIGELRMPVFCRGAAIRPPSLELVAHNVPITCGGAQVHPGDLVVGDGDGIVVVPKGQIAAVLYQVEDVAKWEAAQEKAIKDRVPMAELNDILKKKKILRA